MPRICKLVSRVHEEDTNEDSLEAEAAITVAEEAKTSSTLMNPTNNKEELSVLYAKSLGTSKHNARTKQRR